MLLVMKIGHFVENRTLPYPTFHIFGNIVLKFLIPYGFVLESTIDILMSWN